VKIEQKLYNAINNYINDKLVDGCLFSPIREFEFVKSEKIPPSEYTEERLYLEEADDEAFEILNKSISLDRAMPKTDRSLDDVIKEKQETFSQSLLKIIDQKGFIDSKVYKKAFIDRRLFSKIRSDADYKPSKNTAIALAVALELELDDTLDLIAKAGFTLSLSSKFDLIIRYFVENKVYDIIEINEALDAFGEGFLAV